MDHSEFYHLGNRLALSEDKLHVESEIRNAIGRLYYYVYHEILFWVKSDKQLSNYYLTSTERSSHKKLFDVFYESAKDTKDLRYGKIKRLLCDLHDSRCICDYDLDETIDKSILEEFQADLLDLKDVVLHYKDNVFASVISEVGEVDDVFKTQNFSAKVVQKKKPTLRILE